MTHQEFMKVLNEADFTATATELHGFLTGLVSGGMFNGSEEYLEHMSEMFNTGLSIRSSIKTACAETVSELFDQLDSPEMSFDVMLIDEDESLSDQAEDLLSWVQHFLVGFGLNKRDLKNASNEVREIIQDFTNICQMDTELDDSNETQADFYEVIEFVRVSAVLCYQEFGKRANVDEPKKKTLH